MITPLPKLTIKVSKSRDEQRDCLHIESEGQVLDIMLTATEIVVKDERDKGAWRQKR